MTSRAPVLCCSLVKSNVPTNIIFLNVIFQYCELKHNCIRLHSNGVKAEISEIWTKTTKIIFIALSILEEPNSVFYIKGRVKSNWTYLLVT